MTWLKISMRLMLRLFFRRLSTGDYRHEARGNAMIGLRPTKCAKVLIDRSAPVAR